MDHRDLARATPRWWESYSNRNGLVKVSFAEIINAAQEIGEDIDKKVVDLLDDNECAFLPFEFEVCSTCGGTGTHTDPNIDSHGITSDEWDRDWSYEDREDYMSGVYNVQCYGCEGGKVVPKIKTNILTEDQKKLVKLLDEYRSSLIDDIKERHREMVMGY